MKFSDNYEAKVSSRSPVDAIDRKKQVKLWHASCGIIYEFTSPNHNGPSLKGV